MLRKGVAHSALYFTTNLLIFLNNACVFKKQRNRDKKGKCFKYLTELEGKKAQWISGPKNCNLHGEVPKYFFVRLMQDVDGGTNQKQDFC